MKGIPASPGIAMGRVHKVMTDSDHVLETYIQASVEEELLKLKRALETSKNQIETIKQTTELEMGEHEAQIFESHLMILSDPELVGHMNNSISVVSEHALGAVQLAMDTFVEMFEAMDNPYMQERAADIKDVLGRVIRNLTGQAETPLTSINQPVILLTDDLTPSDTAQLPRQHVLGFITEVGGATSHSAIMARTLEIPAVVGVKNVMEQINHGDTLILDGISGQVIINPDDEIVHQYKKEQAAFVKNKEKLKEQIGLETISKDGRRVELVCNIGSPSDLIGVLENDGEGIGLYRSEFIYMDRDSLPTEEEQFSAYKEVVSKMEGKPVIIRTLDVGGDKDLPYLQMETELNPFLGYRAIRYCLDHEAIFSTQLRAILRASAYGKAKIMFPMISTLNELRKAKALVEKAKSELLDVNIDFDNTIEVGMMIEIPAAAILSDVFAKEVDFFSIGTNDLVQYTLAVDRMNQQLSDLYTPYHPSVIRLVKMVIDNAQKAGIWTGMCGEAAGDENLVPLWFALGLDEFSVSASSVLRVRAQIRSIDQKQLEHVVDNVLAIPTIEEMKVYLENL